MKEIKIEGFKIFLYDKEWRAYMSILSNENEIGEINFRFEINTPIDSIDKNPEKIKEEIFNKMASTAESILSEIKKGN